MVAVPEQASAARPTLHQRRLSPWQLEFMGSVVLGDDQLHAIRGGVGSGKSSVLLVTADALCQTRPGASVVVGMDSFTRLQRVHLPLLQALKPDADWVTSERCYRYANGSAMHLVHLDCPPGQTSPIEGHNAHAVFFDEAQALRPDVLDVAQSRARISVADMTGVVHEPVVVSSGIPHEPAWWVDRVREAGGRIWLPKTADNAANLGASYLERMRSILSDRDYQALVENKPLPPVGQVLYAFKPEDYPGGCIARGWRADPSKHRFALVVDFGLRSPAALLLAEDTALNAWVVCREWAPDDCSTPELGRLLARELVGTPLAFAYADPAGQARNAQTRVADLDVLAAQSPEGIGRRPLITTDPVKRDIVAGCTRLNVAFERRRLLIAGDVFDAGLRAPANRRTLARALSGYRLDERTGEPAKDGTHDHHIDALRYFAQHQLWHTSPVDGRLRVGADDKPQPTRAAGIIRGTGRWQR